MILDNEWVAWEMQRDLEADAAYVAKLTLEDPDRIPTYLAACNYAERLEQWKALRS